MRHIMPHRKPGGVHTIMVEVRRRTEGGEAPRWQGVTTENIGHI
jgi:hypothetical protein